MSCDNIAAMSRIRVIAVASAAMHFLLPKESGHRYEDDDIAEVGHQSHNHDEHQDENQDEIASHSDDAGASSESDPGSKESRASIVEFSVTFSLVLASLRLFQCYEWF